MVTRKLKLHLKVTWALGHRGLLETGWSSCVAGAGTGSRKGRVLGLGQFPDRRGLEGKPGLHRPEAGSPGDTLSVGISRHPDGLSRRAGDACGVDGGTRGCRLGLGGPQHPEQCGQRVGRGCGAHGEGADSQGSWRRPTEFHSLVNSTESQCQASVFCETVRHRRNGQN